MRPYFGIGKVPVNDIDKKNIDESEKRLLFFQLWVEQEGSGATYYKLLTSLLAINNKEDAEYVCKLLQKKKYVSVSNRTDSISNETASPVVGMFAN